ncbi:hypothetical protein CMV_012545 [Castanea mollissima]|uniref:Universal stress protein n=1 Tax=Castanea mollissima TaxID=60419 RepID=A0A8J4R9C7_9ROSI|nr:hypothetical protein CMV_012545 [Castanea mollissima]
MLDHYGCLGQSLFPSRQILWEASVPCESLWGWKKILLMRGKPSFLLKLNVGMGRAFLFGMKMSHLCKNMGIELCMILIKAVATTAALAKKYGADITVVVIDERQKESLPEHETQLSSIRWHLSEGGFEEFKLLERLGEGNKSTAIIGEVADDLNLDLVVISMEAIHSKDVDANLLAEFIPCPVVLLPL